ncbi:hypothetical protein EYR36_009219 [Pleurotus pulmonarius]|nr:hypothetical protein EYR36_009219 [Pleurotus pulmonarius]KAF4592719.1 hypothetical protein EYR38_008419 [Pleurotus pulmonarius]
MSVRQGPLGLQSSRTSEATIHSRSPPPVAPVFTGGFFDRTPEAARARAAYFKVLAGGLGLLTITIFAVLSIYWGALWRTDRFIRNLNGWIVDFDGGDIGAAVVQNFLGVNGEPMKISWEIRPASDFPNGVDDLAQAVISERCWVALSINQNATARLNAAVASLDANYDGTSAVTAFGVEARNEDAYRVLLKPNIDIPMDQLSVNFANQFARTLISRQIDISALLSTAPQIITRPAYFTIRNLRPFDVPVASAVTFVGLIYLLIISGIANGARLAAGFEQRLSLPSLISTRIVTSISMYFILSLFYSLQSLAFQLPFNRRFGHPGFLVFWMLMWFGMTALGLAVEAMFTLLTPRFIPFFLVLWIISNVSTCFYPLETLPAFYRYGYASPFYNVSRGIRTIVFSTRNMLGLNFGVLIAWIAISCITIPLTSWLDITNWLRHARFQSITAAYDALRGKRASSNVDPYTEEILRRKRAYHAHYGHRPRAEHAYYGGRHNWHASADDRWKDRIILVVGITALVAGIAPGLYMFPTSMERRHQAAVAGLAQARSEAREVGDERMRELRKRAQEIRTSRTER